MPRREKPAGTQGREGSVVLQLLFAARCRVRGFELDFRPHDPRARWPARSGTVRREKTSAGVGRDEFGRQERAGSIVNTQAKAGERHEKSPKNLMRVLGGQASSSQFFRDRRPIYRKTKVCA